MTADSFSLSLLILECCTFSILSLTTYHLAKKALSSKTGPKREKATMKHYSGIHEADSVAVMVNLMISVAYFGGLTETVSNVHDGFFHKNKYLPYTFTCPLIMYDLVYSTGGLYKVPIAVLTWVTLLIAYLADVMPNPARWMWFALGSVLYLVLIYFIYGAFSRAFKICTSLMKKRNPHSASSKGSVRSWNSEDDYREDSHQLKAMRQARIYMCIAISILFIVWPAFPVLFVMEHLHYTTLETTITFFCVLDVFAKGVHTFMVEKYRELMLERLSTYGFLSPDVLRKIDADRDVSDQLHQLAQARKSLNTATWVDKPRRVTLQEMSKASRRSLSTIESGLTELNRTLSPRSQPFERVNIEELMLSEEILDSDIGFGTPRPTRTPSSGSTRAGSQEWDRFEPLTTHSWRNGAGGETEPEWKIAAPKSPRPPPLSLSF